MMAPVPFATAWAAVPDRAKRHFPTESVLEAQLADAEDRGACLACGDGIIAVKTEGDDNGGRRLFVLLAAATTGEPGAFKRRQAEVLRIGRMFHCSAVAFTTDRVRAWRRVLGPEWVQTGDEFSRSLR